MVSVVHTIAPTEDVNEHAVRAAAGITLLIAVAAFCLALFEQVYVPLQVASSFFLLEFLVRTRIGIRFSPVGVVAHWMTRRYPPQWLSARPKLFAWNLGLGMALAMTVITNSGIRGVLPGTLCGVCITLMWLETALGLCLGCEIHSRLVRRGWRSAEDDLGTCAHGVCEVPARAGNG